MSWIRFEGAAYWIAFVATFLAVSLWESFAPRRKLSNAAERRWSRHGILLAISFALGTFLLRISPLTAAALAVNNGPSPLNNPALPFAVRCLATVLLLDLIHYWIHRTFHRVPWLWRVHEVHHSDPDFDVSTAARFHPLEVLGVQVVYLGVILLLAPPVFAVFFWEVLGVVSNLLEHANASLPPWAENLVRRVFVTPDLHRIHHSEEIDEQSRNLGEIFPWWDRLFGTYLGRPAAPDTAFATGLRGLQSSDSLGIGFMLAEPFRRADQEDPAREPDPYT